MPKYDHPERPWETITVTEPTPVDGPPAAEEGRIVSVDVRHRVPTASPTSWIRCQVCPRTMRYVDPHVLVHIRIEDRIGARFSQARFCSPECWASWASQ